MSLSTMAAARQKEMKLSMAVVATITLGTGWAEPRAGVREVSIAMLRGRHCIHAPLRCHHTAEARSRSCW